MKKIGQYIVGIAIMVLVLLTNTVQALNENDMNGKLTQIVNAMAGNVWSVALGEEADSGTSGSKLAMALEVTLDENNHMKATIVANGNGANVESIKVVKLENVNDTTTDIDTQGTELLITPAEQITIEHTFEETGIYIIKATTSLRGDYETTKVYAYSEYDVSITDNTINIEATGALSNINEIVVTNKSTGTEEPLSITPAAQVSATYEATEYGEYEVKITDEIGFNVAVSGEVRNTNTLSLETVQDATNSRKINITAIDTEYNIVELKWVEGAIANENVNTVFSSSAVNTISVTPAKNIVEAIEVERFGTYTIYVKNSKGDIYVNRITIIGQDIPTIDIEKDKTNNLKLTIVAQDGEEKIISVKIVKKAKKDDVVDFTTQGTELLSTPAQKVTIEHTCAEPGIYVVYAVDESGNYMTQMVYAYSEFPVQHEVTVDDKTINIKAEGILADIVQIKVLNQDTQKEEELSITRGKTVSISYEAEVYGSYKIYIIDELGFEKQVQLTLIEQVEDSVESTITYSKSTFTNEPVIATITFNRDDITITNNNGKNTYEFTQNNTFTFEYTTSKGVTGSQQAKVDWIKPVKIDDDYSIVLVDNNNYIKKVEAGTKVEEFLTTINVIDANYKVYDEFDNSIPRTSVLATGMMLKADNQTYTIIARGDVNGDGKFSSTDISKLALHIIRATPLTGAYYHGADMNLDDTITLTDISQMLLKIVNLE